MGINEITAEMTPQEKEIYFAHQEKRHREEAEKVEMERERLRAYKNSLISEIMEKSDRFTLEELVSKGIRTLEMMAW